MEDGLMASTAVRIGSLGALAVLIAVGIGTAITCSSSTGNPAAATSLTTVTDGTATVVTTAPGVGPTATVSFTTTNAGVWHVETVYYGASGQIAGVEIVNIVVSFLVIPE